MFQVSIMLFQVKDCSFKVGDVIAHEANASVAVVAQETTNLARGMAVIHEEVLYGSPLTRLSASGFSCAADGTLPSLVFVEPLVVLLSDAKLQTKPVITVSSRDSVVDTLEASVPTSLTLGAWVSGVRGGVLVVWFTLQATTAFFHGYKRATLSIGSGWQG